MRHSYIILFCCSLLAWGCKSNSDNNKTNTPAVQVAPPAPASKLDNSGTEKLVTLVTDYYGLKDAFVATDANKADTAALKLAVGTGDMLAYLKNDSTNNKVLKPYLDTISMQVKDLLAIKDDKDCEKKRLPFSKISDAVYTLLKKADLKNAGVYYEHCPMAFDEKGAYWLSDETEIKNPYFGKKMIECGEVMDSLK